VLVNNLQQERDQIHQSMVIELQKVRLQTAYFFVSSKLIEFISSFLIGLSDICNGIDIPIQTVIPRDCESDVCVQSAGLEQKIEARATSQAMV